MMDPSAPEAMLDALEGEFLGPGWVLLLPMLPMLPM